MLYLWQNDKQKEYIQKTVDCVKENHSKQIFEWFCLMLSKWLDESPKDDFGIDNSLEAAEYDTRQKFKLDCLLF